MRIVDIVRKVASRGRSDYLAAFEQGESLLVKNGITTPARLAHFLAQILHESGGLSVEWENMSYSAPRLVEIFGVGRHSAKVTETEARTLAHNPAMIAERVYGHGNPAKAKELGNIRLGDGFLYRGGGLMQTTGRANYREAAKRCGVPFEESPDLVVSAEHALKPALFEWTRGKLNAFADANDILAISRAINLGNPKINRMPNGWEDRKAWFNKVTPHCDGVSFPVDSPATTRSRRSRAATRPGAPLDILPPMVRESLPPAPRPDVFEIQTRLAAMQLYLDEIDGLLGPATRTAIQTLFLNQSVKNFERWPDERMIIAARQLFCRMDGIDVGDIDGLLGTRSEQAFLVYEARRARDGEPDPSVEEWRDEEAPAAQQPLAPATPATPQPSRPATTVVRPSSAPVWPRQAEVAAFFGPPGSSQTTLELPFRMRIAWDTAKSVTKVQCHTKVRKHLERIWLRTLEHYGLSEIRRLRLDLFGGCLNVRPMRGGTAWSMHAYGIAWDVDPDRNKLKMGRDQATLDAPEYNAFWGFIYDEGAISLGRERNFDWMHFQFARL